MFDQDRSPQPTKCKTRNHFGQPPEAIANQPPDKHAARGHHKGSESDRYRDDDDVDLEKREEIPTAIASMLVPIDVVTKAPSDLPLGAASVEPQSAA